MLVSALLLVRYLYGGGRVHQLLSGAFAGLAFLTKSPAGFLIPYAALATAFCHLKVRFAQNSLSGRASKARAWGRWLWAVARDLGVWGLAAVCVFVFHVETVHRNPNFFAGQVIDSDAGPLFYLATIAWKTTLVTLPALLATVPFLLWRTKRERNVGPVWWVLAYACGFTAAMTFAARKEIRYLILRASACPRTASHSETFR